MKLQHVGPLLLSVSLLVACLPGARGDGDNHVPEIVFDYPDTTFATPESSTRARLKLLATVASEIGDLTGELPSSMDAILALRRGSEYANPKPEWAIDGWGRSIRIVRHADRTPLLIISLGPDGVIGGADDYFVIVRSRRSAPPDSLR